MVNFNLLPWREMKISYEKNQLKKILVAAFMVSIILNYAGYHLVLFHVKKSQDHLARWQKEERRLFSLFQSTIIPAQSANSPALLAISENVRKFLIELPKIMSDNLCFTELKRVNKTIYFSGNSISFSALNEFLTQWNFSYLLQQIQIKKIQNNAETGLIEFQLVGAEN